MNSHHPQDDLLLGLAAGRLSAGAALVVSAHLEVCGECRARLHTLQAVGGEVLEQATPVAPAPGAWERTLASIDVPAPPPVVAAASEPPAAWPSDVKWPASLTGCTVLHKPVDADRLLDLIETLAGAPRPSAPARIEAQGRLPI